MTNKEFILKQRCKDIRQLALKKVPEGVDLKFCLQQIEGWQIARNKIPEWTSRENILYPPHISLEQCSSQLTAQYKSSLALRLLPEEERLSFADLTGGYGIDFSYIATHFRKAIYVEQQEDLCKIARHNFPLLGLHQAEVLKGDCMAHLSGFGHLDLIFVDPARRDNTGRKTVAMEDCVPDMTLLYPRLKSQATLIVVKLSPMLDIKNAIRVLPDIREIHVVSVCGECKELLIVLDPTHKERITYYCINLGTKEIPLVWKEGIPHCKPVLSENVLKKGNFLYEPNASILKAGLQDELCNLFDVKKLHPHSHLFIGEKKEEEFPGRTFQIEGYSSFSKKELKSLLGDIQRANITTRNFPVSVAKLRRQLKLGEGGDTYLFATTLRDGSHALIRCIHPQFHSV